MQARGPLQVICKHVSPCTSTPKYTQASSPLHVICKDLSPSTVTLACLQTASPSHFRQLGDVVPVKLILAELQPRRHRTVSRAVMSAKLQLLPEAQSALRVVAVISLQLFSPRQHRSPLPSMFTTSPTPSSSPKQQASVVDQAPLSQVPLHATSRYHLRNSTSSTIKAIRVIGSVGLRG